ncbi:MAG: hypothetical protein J0M00_18465 [Burkholderiales bacterium]|nr:hypothetical protein [Burkholderiales bacterium]
MTGKAFPVSVRVQPGQLFSVSVGQGAQCRIEGIITVSNWGGSRLPSSLSLGNNSRLYVNGDFEIGPNVHISANADAELVLGGRKHSSGSGITCNSRIMAAKHIHIGSDTIIAWDIFISDSDWHQIEGAKMDGDVRIGDHVWIAHGASVLKGSVIPDGSVVAAKSLVHSVFQGSNLLLAGTPARVIREDVKWMR